MVLAFWWKRSRVGEKSIHDSNMYCQWRLKEVERIFLRIQQCKHSKYSRLFTMNTIILFTTFLFFHHQILAIYALTCPTFQEIAVRLPNGQKFALLLPKSFVETKIAIFFYGTNLSLLFIKIEHIQNCFVCNKSLNNMKFNCLGEFYCISFKSFRDLVLYL